MLILVADACTNASFLATVLFIRKLVKIISIIIPILLVLLVTIDMLKAVMASDDNQIKKVQSLAIKRIIWALVIFFVPIVVNATLSLFEGKEVAGITCYNNATDGVVDALQQAEKESLLKYEEDIQRLIDLAKESKEAYYKELERLRILAANHNSGNSNQINSSGRIRANGKIAEASSSGLQVVRFKSGLNRWKWEYVFRFKDPKKAALAAKCMEAGVANKKYIKYCGKYGQLYDRTKKYGFDVSKVNRRTCTTCSPYVSVCVNYAGIRMKRAWNAASEKETLDEIKKLSKHFEIIHNPKIAQDYTKLYRGDILFKNKYNGMGHVVMAT